MLRKPLPDVLKGMADHRKPCYCYFSQPAGLYVLGVFIPGVADNHSNGVYRREKEKGIIEYRISNIGFRISDIEYTGVRLKFIWIGKTPVDVKF